MNNDSSQKNNTTQKIIISEVKKQVFNIHSNRSKPYDTNSMVKPSKADNSKNSKWGVLL